MLCYVVSEAVMMDDQKCVFNFKYQCKPSLCSKNRDRTRIDTIIYASKLYKDNLHEILEPQLAANPNLTIHYHKNCVSRYTSTSNYPKQVDSNKPPKKKLRKSHTAFDFLEQCLYCGEKCDLSKDTKHPDRWREAYKCRSTVSANDHRPYKQYILDICQERDDEWSNIVRIRVEGAISDLHAVEARYHVDCYSRFVSNRLPKGESKTVNTKQVESSGDPGLLHIIALMKQDKLRIWNSVELFSEYQSHDGVLMSRDMAINKLQKHFGGDLIILSSPGYANIIAFRSQTALQLKLVKDEDDEDISSHINKVAKKVIKECTEIPLNKASYRLDLDISTAYESVSDLLMTFLGSLSPKLLHTLPALMIGNMITSVIRNQPTDLQVALGVLLRDSKSLIGYMYDYGITCSYDEVLRFKKSAAKAASTSSDFHGIGSCNNGMVQVIVDNFDAEISSPNGKLSTHSLAIILTQPTKLSQTFSRESIDRMTLTECKLPIDDDDADFVHYSGMKKPPMPDMPSPKLPEEWSSSENVSSNRAKEIDFQFFKDITSRSDCPEFGGYNTKMCREQGHTVQPRTQIAYLPMINKPPSEHSTMMTAMLKAKTVTEKTGQKFVVFTADQQLYKVAVHIMWENQSMFSNFYLRLGGMHLLMSYVGCVGSLMAGSGIVEVLGAAFAGVRKMLIGKKFPDNIRALRMLVEELLRPLFEKNPDMSCMDELLCTLDVLSKKSRTAKLWVTCVIQPVFTIMMYVRAEREGDWALHLASVRNMMPLFFAASHINYARYGMYYLRTMEQLPNEVREHFIKGEHVMHLNPGINNGIWSDMSIETTFMRYGHSKSGIIGVTLKPETVKTWTYSIHACNTLISKVDSMRNTDPNEKLTQLHHKEEAKYRIKLDAADRQVLREKLEICIDPLHEHEHTKNLVNIVTGQIISNESVNVDNAYQVGTNQMKLFENGWPESFHGPIHKSVTTMYFGEKNIKVAEKKVYDTEIIYARAMALQNSVRGLNTNELMAHELSPVPASMFSNKSMRTCTTKATLKNKLKVEISARHVAWDASFLDGCAVMWVIPWPANATVQHYLDNFRCHISIYLQKGPVFLIFDRYVKCKG